MQFWVNDVFWLKGALGFGIDSLQLRRRLLLRQRHPVGLGITGVGGLDRTVPGFALDLQLRVAHMSYDFGGATNLALMVGFNWY